LRTVRYVIEIKSCVVVIMYVLTKLRGK